MNLFTHGAMGYQKLRDLLNVKNMGNSIATVVMATRETC